MLRRERMAAFGLGAQNAVAMGNPQHVRIRLRRGVMDSQLTHATRAFTTLQRKHGSQTRCCTTDQLQKNKSFSAPVCTRGSAWHSHWPLQAGHANMWTAKDRWSMYNLFWTVWRHGGRRAYHSWCCQRGVRMKPQLISISIFSIGATGSDPPNYENIPHMFLLKRNSLSSCLQSLSHTSSPCEMWVGDTNGLPHLPKSLLCTFYDSYCICVCKVFLKIAHEQLVQGEVPIHWKYCLQL